MALRSDLVSFFLGSPSAFSETPTPLSACLLAGSRNGPAASAGGPGPAVGEACAARTHNEYPASMTSVLMCLMMGDSKASYCIQVFELPRFGNRWIRPCLFCDLKSLANTSGCPPLSQKLIGSCYVTARGGMDFVSSISPFGYAAEGQERNA